MNWKIDFNEAANFIRVSTHGGFTIEDCIKIKEDLLALQFWKPGINVLLDYRDTSFNDLTLDLLRLIGDYHESKSEEIGNGKMVFLMKSPRDFGFARQYEMVTEGKVLSQVRVFLEEDKAIEWICNS